MESQTLMTTESAITTNAARVAQLSKRARTSTIIALACLSLPLGLVPASMGLEMAALAAGLAALMAAAHFAGELKKAKAAL